MKKKFAIFLFLQLWSFKTRQNCPEKLETILGDPGADRGGKGKSKWATENGHEEKHSRARRAPGDKFLPDQFQIAGVILNSDWCQKFFVFFCPIRSQQAVKSFRVFLHGNNLIAMLAWFVWQGFARGESLNHSTKCTGNRSEYRRRNTLDLSQVSLQSLISKCARFL